MSGLFEHLAATDDSQVIAHRKASAVANKRVKDRFAAFLANATSDLPARLALIDDDITEIVQEVVAEYGGDAQKIEAAIKRSMDPAMGGGVGGMGAMGMPGGGGGVGAPGAAPAAQTGQGTCPQCCGPLVNGQCPTCQSGAVGGAGGAQGGAYGLTHSMPQTPSTGPVMAQVKESRRPKMCPYHSEVVDISLGTGDPQSGFNAMSAHSWGDKHCKGDYEGTCNFRPSMVTQKYWDDKKAEYDDRREQRELERAQQSVTPDFAQEPELSIDTEPIMHAEPLSDEPGKEGVTDIDGELANAPSAVGAGEMAMASSTHKEAEALKTVDLPTGNDTALGGPSPKIDKSKSGDQGGWSLEDIDTQMDGSPHPSITQDPTDKADYNKEDFLDQTRAVTTTEALPTSTNADDAGFNTDREITQHPTKTWSGQDGQHAPVTNQALSHRRAAPYSDQDKLNATGQPPQSGQPSPGTPEYDQWIQQQRAQMQHLMTVPEGTQIQYDNNRMMPPGWKGGPVTDSGDPNYLQNIQNFQQRGFSHTHKGAQDPDKNPIREIMEEYEGFLMPNQVESAIRDWTVG